MMRNTYLPPIFLVILLLLSGLSLATSPVFATAFGKDCAKSTQSEA